MTGTWRSSQVQVRLLASGAVRVGPYTTSPAGAARICVPGATFVIDPMLPHYPPIVEISDHCFADDTVRVLFGDEVATEVHLCAQQQTPTTTLSSVTFSPQLYDLSLLGHLVWLYHASPWPMPAAVLSAELTNFAGRCHHLVDDPAALSRVIADQAGSFTGALAAVSHATGYPPGVTNLLLQAARVISHHIPIGHPDRDALLGAIHALSAADPPTSRQTNAQPLAAVVRSCTPTAAVHAGDDGRLFTGSVTADWSRNSHGVIARDEDAITWAVETAASQAHLTVVATKSAPPPQIGSPALAPISADGLVSIVSDLTKTSATAAACSFHTPAWPLALTEVLLSPQANTGNLTGSTSLSQPASVALAKALRQGTLIVDTHDAGWRFPHLARLSPTVEAARRWTIRATCATRVCLTASNPDLTRAAENAWRRALALWRHTGRDNQSLADERVRHCTAWLHLLDPENAPRQTPLIDLATPISSTATPITTTATPDITPTTSEILAAGLARPS